MPFRILVRATARVTELQGPSIIYFLISFMHVLQQSVASNSWLHYLE